MTARQGRRRENLVGDLNPLKAELNPICHLLVLLGAHHILHISRIRVKEIRTLEVVRGRIRLCLLRTIISKRTRACCKTDG